MHLPIKKAGNCKKCMNERAGNAPTEESRSYMPKLQFEMSLRLSLSNPDLVYTIQIYTDGTGNQFWKQH